MEFTIKLTEDEIKKIIAKEFQVDKDNISLNFVKSGKYDNIIRCEATIRKYKFIEENTDENISDYF